MDRQLYTAYRFAERAPWFEKCLRTEEAEVRAVRERNFLAAIRDRFKDTHEEANSHDR